MKIVYFITHPEVMIDPKVPVPHWPLSERGLVRMRRLLQQPWVAKLPRYTVAQSKRRLMGHQSSLRIFHCLCNEWQDWEKMIARQPVFFSLSSSKRSLSNSLRILGSRFEAGRRLQQRSGVLSAPSLRL